MLRVQVLGFPGVWTLKFRNWSVHLEGFQMRTSCFCFLLQVSLIPLWDTCQMTQVEVCTPVNTNLEIYPSQMILFKAKCLFLIMKYKMGLILCNYDQWVYFFPHRIWLIARMLLCSMWKKFLVAIFLPSCTLIQIGFGDMIF